MSNWTLNPDRGFAPETTQRQLARNLYKEIRDLPLLSPHGHVPAELLLNNEPLGNPASTFVVPDHYLVRMLYSQGVPMESLGIPRLDGGPSQTDPREIWRVFASHFHLFTGTPSGLWLQHELIDLFGLDVRPSAETADQTFDHLTVKLESPDYRPRTLFRNFGLEVLATTDAATDALTEHGQLQEAGFNVVPTMRPDALLDPAREDFSSALDLLRERTGSTIENYASYLDALRSRRAAFKTLGATATDHAALTAEVQSLDRNEASAIFSRALSGSNTPEDSRRFASHMLLEMARMSVDDGLVMQLHVGSMRDHHPSLFRDYGRDRGADIPVATEWTRALQPLLAELGGIPAFRMVLYTLDETTYSRELAPLAGHYPALRLGAPWWFFDSVLGMERYLDAVVETAGIYNLAGFVDDTRAFPSIPARHDVWRRTASNWLAGRVVRGLIDEDQAPVLARALALDLARDAFRLP